MKHRVDLNCDLGESYGVFRIGNDERIMPCITSANIACGFHAGDPTTIAKTVSVAKKHHVAIGAHPGFPDLMGFGRREMQSSPEEIQAYMIYQIGALQGFAETAGTQLQHVKPHGALYNKAAKDRKLSKAIAEAIRTLNRQLIVFAPPASALASIAREKGLRVAHEFFADRSYNSSGSLVSREAAGAVILEPGAVVKRAIQALTEGTVLAADGKELDLGEIHTICVHGDNPMAVKLAGSLKKGLSKAGVEIEQVGRFI